MADDSKATDVGARYARALFDLAVETGELTAIEADLKTLKILLGESPELRGMLASPAFKAEVKGRVLAALADRANLNGTTRKFLGLLAQNGRVSALNAIITSFQALSADYRGVVSAEVVTAVPMSDAQTRGLVSALQASLGKTPEIETRVDPAILGGVKVRVGSRLYDASLKSKLDSLKFALKRA